MDIIYLTDNVYSAMELVKLAKLQQLLVYLAMTSFILVEVLVLLVMLIVQNVLEEVLLVPNAASLNIWIQIMLAKIVTLIV
jgi:hypothetical protein